MCDSYVVEKILELPPTPTEDGRPLWKGYCDALIFAGDKIFYFTRVSLGDYLKQEYAQYSVKVWKSKARREKNGLDRYNQTLMEISTIKPYSYRPWKTKKIPGHGIGVQYVREVAVEELPAIKERVVMQLI